jgi:HPt (histidine-containing phosphotransfer) domain-containing protein
MTELLRRTALSPEQRECTETILGCAGQLLALIDDMLDFSAARTGRLALETRPFTLRELLAGAVGVLGHTATMKGIALTWSVDDDVPDALAGDANRLRQVLLNLLSNAVKFTVTGRVSLRVARESETPTTADTVVLRFEVADTGIGIPPDKQGGIFDPFVQGDGTTTRRHGGTGLGLAICARLTQLMGGRIWVESAVGSGSIFRFTARLGVAARERPALDRRQLVERIGEDPEILQQLIGVFRDESRMLLAEIGRALAARDARRVERAAHRLRGSLGTLAALPAEDVALELETLGRTGNLGPAAERYAVLDQEITRLEPELAALAAPADPAI